MGHSRCYNDAPPEPCRGMVVQGTTPYVYFEIDPEEVAVADVTNAEMTVKNDGVTTLHKFGELIIDEEHNAIGYHFTQEETLGLSSGKKAWVALHCMAGEERLATEPPLMLEVIPTDRRGKMEVNHG